MHNSHSVRAVCAFAVALLPQHAVRQRDGGVRTPLALNRVLVEREEVVWGPGSSARVSLPAKDTRATHIREILQTETLRAGVVDHFLVDDAPVTVLKDLSVLIDLPEEKRRPAPPPPPITLMLAMPRPKVLLRLLPHIAALGIKRLVLVGAYKVEKAYWHCDVLKTPSVARAALVEGVMQAGMDVRIPEISAHRFLKPFLEDTLPGLAGPNVIRILAEPDMKGTRIADAVSTASAAIGTGGAREAIIAVGPEGGWMPREISMLEELHGFSRITLGPRILKTDAAVIVLLGLLHDALQRENVGCM